MRKDPREPELHLTSHHLFGRNSRSTTPYVERKSKGQANDRQPLEPWRSHFASLRTRRIGHFVPIAGERNCLLMQYSNVLSCVSAINHDLKSAGLGRQAALGFGGML